MSGAEGRTSRGADDAAKKKRTDGSSPAPISQRTVKKSACPLVRRGS